MEPRITLITLGVEDLDRSIAFYRDGLGLPLRDGPDGVAFFTTGDLDGFLWEVAFNPFFWVE